MGLFSKKPVAPVVTGRAIAHTGTFSQEDVSDDRRNKNNLSATAHVRMPALLELVAVDDGGPIPSDVQRLYWSVANWVRFLVLGLDDGSGRYDAAPDPESIRIPVLVDAATRRITRVDDELIELELAQWRELASDAWKRTEGVFASAHQVGELADFGRTEVPGIMREWVAAARELREELARPTEVPAIPTSPIAPEEVARRLAEADAMRPTIAASGGFGLKMMRVSLLPQFRRQAEGVRDGLMPGHQFDLDIECQFRSGVFTAEEVAELRGIAGTPGFG